MSAAAQGSVALQGFISPSEIVSRGLGLQPAEGPLAKRPCQCMACGQPIATGAVAVPWRPPVGTFTDYQYLVDKQGVLCAWCPAFTAANMMDRTQKMVANCHGAWQLAKDDHRAWLLESPPDPPFVAVVSDQQRQHLVWRAPVTLSKELIGVQVGRRSLWIDRTALADRLHDCTESASMMRRLGYQVTPNHPFARLDRDLLDAGHGCLNDTALALLAADDSADADHDDTAGVRRSLRDRLCRLLTTTEGELWALAVLAKATPPTPTPESLSLAGATHD